MPNAITEYGFDWGNVRVVRAAHDPKYGRVLLIRTPRESAQIRITPSGLIRVGDKEDYVWDGHADA